MPHRRPGVDVARILALVAVVIGHLVLAVIDRFDGDVRGANLIALHPSWELLAALAPMPIFFAAAGWANRDATIRTAAPRLRALVGLAGVVVGVWSLAVVGVTRATGDAGVVGDGARIATQPLWFLAAYVPFAASGAALGRAAVRRPVVLLAGGLALLGLLDVARFGFGAPEWIGWPGFFVAWGLPWLAGAWWRDLVERRRGDERVVGAVMALAALVGCVVLVTAAGYSPALIDAAPNARSNTTPPTLYTAVAGLAQVGILLIGARGLDRIGVRWRRFWSRAGDAAVGVYVWHLTALALCAGLVSLGVAMPERLTWGWWAARPLWWAAVLGTTAVLVWATAVIRSHIPPRLGSFERASAWRPTLGVAATALGAGLVGLRGPRTTPLAIACEGLFVLAWWLLRPPRPMRAP